MTVDPVRHCRSREEVWDLAPHRWCEERFADMIGDIGFLAPPIQTYKMDSKGIRCPLRSIWILEMVDQEKTDRTERVMEMEVSEDVVKRYLKLMLEVPVDESWKVYKELNRMDLGVHFRVNVPDASSISKEWRTITMDFKEEVREDMLLKLAVINIIKTHLGHRSILLGFNQSPNGVSTNLATGLSLCHAYCDSRGVSTSYSIRAAKCVSELLF